MIYLFLFCIGWLEACMMHQEPVKEHWVEENLAPFDELMLTWNAARPNAGKYLFHVRVKIGNWSPWLLYAIWGSEGQSSFSESAEGAPVRVYQDAVELLGGNKATGFQIKIETEGDACLDQVYHLHLYTNSDRKTEAIHKIEDAASLCLQVPGLSQISLPHERKFDLCSPTSTTAVSRFLSQNYAIDPICFAQKSWDRGFDLFGNWVFNLAQASTELGREWKCWVERLNSFQDVYRRLQEGIPVIVSIRGPLAGSALAYACGHLLVVTGYDALQQKVICMDPAFPSDAATHVLYDFSDFMQAWERRGRVAYIFTR